MNKLKEYTVPILLLVRAAGIGEILKKVIDGETGIPEGTIADSIVHDIEHMIAEFAKIIPVKDLMEAEREYYGRQTTWLN